MQLPYIPCPHCDHYQFLDWDNFTWAGKDDEAIKDDPLTVKYICQGCTQTFDDSTRLKWLEKLKWVKQNPESNIAGFHINAFYSPWSKWSELIEKYLAATNIIKKMVWTNTTLGIPFSLEAIRSPEWEELAKKTGNYSRYEIPANTKVLLAACDVQMDRLEVSLIAFHRSQAYVITHEVFPGVTANIDDECWDELDQFLNRDWNATDGSTRRIHRLAIDAHYQTNTVANYARKRKRVVPVTGIDNWKTELLPSRPLDIKKNGKYFRTGKRRWPIGVSVVKLDLYNRLKLERAQNGELPSEYIHFPKGMPDEYYKQLTGETCKLDEDSRGKPKMVWEQRYEAVEALDCFVYVLGLYKICGLHLWSEERWERPPIG